MTAIENGEVLVPSYHIPQQPAAVINTSPLNTASGLNMLDLSELGAKMVAVGMTPLDVRELISDVQRIATRAATEGVDALLTRIQQIQQTRQRDLTQAVATMPAVPPPGFIQRAVGAPSDAISRAAVQQLLASWAFSPLRAGR